jgi:hypothetical protein
MHEFQPVEPGIDQCGAVGASGIECGMPAANGRHVQKAAEQPDGASRRVYAPVNAALDAEGAFHALLMDEDSPKCRVFCAIACAGARGITDNEMYELPELSTLSQSTIRPRRVDLETDGLVTKALDSQNRIVKRETRSGGWATVWVLTDKARQLLLSDHTRKAVA